MHADELEIDDALVRGLLAEQFPDWADLPRERVEPQGTVNAVFRLGDELAVRLARRKGRAEPGGRELEWLPKLAPLLPLEVPVPVAQGHPTAAYPWCWDVYRWIDGVTAPVEEIDAIQAARDLGPFVAALQTADPDIGLRLAFSSGDDALGASPDPQLADEAPAPVRAAIDFGRTPA
jgi:aminoglycoside phosphotransferase (APT) family kinase protein